MSRIFAPHPDVVTEYHDREAILLNPASGKVHRLDPVSSVVWTLVDGTNCVEQIIDISSSLIDAPDSVLKSDIYTLLSDFYTMELIRPIGETEEKVTQA